MYSQNWDSNICFVVLLVLHKNKIEGAVEDCVDKVRGGQIEDEEVGHGPHLPVIWTVFLTFFLQYLEKTATRTFSLLKALIYIDNFCVSISIVTGRCKIIINLVLRRTDDYPEDGGVAYQRGDDHEGEAGVPEQLQRAAHPRPRGLLQTRHHALWLCSGIQQWHYIANIIYPPGEMPCHSSVYLSRCCLHVRGRR